jgi:hypothetical protein
MKKLVVLLTILALPCVASAWDYNAEFTIAGHNNPNGVWSYGYLDSTWANFAYHTTTVGPGGDLGGWAGEPRLNDWCTNDPDVLGNNTKNVSMDEIYYESWPGGMYWAPGASNLMTPNLSNPAMKATARFIAPADGVYDISASFKNSVWVKHPAEVKVLVNGVEDEGGQISGFGYASVLLGQAAPDAGSIFDYVKSLQLNADDTVDFSIGWIQDAGLGWYEGSYHQVGFQAVIVPEPFTMALMGLGGLALLRRRR